MGGLRNAVVIFLCISVAGLSGCSHRLQVKNIDLYDATSLQPLEEKVTIGLVSTSRDIYGKKLVRGVGEELGKYSAKVVYPYRRDSAKPVDIEARLAVHPEYKGSGWNFLINFPGFLLFVPAINGYVYKVNYDLDIELVDVSTGNRIDTFELPIHLDVRHAAINRTWTEASWFEFGAIALIGGVVFVQYDPSVTPLVMNEIESPIGDYIAEQIVLRLNASGVLVKKLPEPPVAKDPAAEDEVAPGA